MDFYECPGCKNQNFGDFIFKCANEHIYCEKCSLKESEIVTCPVCENEDANDEGRILKNFNQLLQDGSWRFVDRYGIGVKSNLWYPVDLFVLSKERTEKQFNALVYIFQKLHITLNEDESEALSEESITEIIAAIIKAADTSESPKGFYETFQNRILKFINSSAIHKNGEPTTSLSIRDIIDPKEIVSVSRMKHDAWDDMQYFIETKSNWIYYSDIPYL